MVTKEQILKVMLDFFMDKSRGYFISKEQGNYFYPWTDGTVTLDGKFDLPQLAERIHNKITDEEIHREHMENHGPNGDATTPGFFKEPKKAINSIEQPLWPHAGAVTEGKKEE